MAIVAKLKGNKVRILHVYYAEGRRKEKWFKDHEAQARGFKPGWTIAEAKAWAKVLSAQERTEKLEGKRQRIEARLREQDKALALQEPYWSQFVTDWGARIGTKRGLTQCRAVARIMSKINLPVERWGAAPHAIHKALENSGLSLDYVWRLLGVINEWGRFLAYSTGKFYVDVRPPKREQAEAIRDRQRRRESQPLTPEKLRSARNGFDPKEYNWLLLTVWFGLRPHEVKDVHMEVVSEGDLRALQVYQPKLTKLPKERRYKFIPLLFPEQIKAITLWKTEGIKRPLKKTVKKYCGTMLYGGRKGFVELMNQKGRKLVEISAWMGHRDIERTRRQYEKPKKIVIGE